RPTAKAVVDGLQRALELVALLGEPHVALVRRGEGAARRLRTDEQEPLALPLVAVADAVLLHPQPPREELRLSVPLVLRALEEPDRLLAVVPHPDAELMVAAQAIE